VLARVEELGGLDAVVHLERGPASLGRLALVGLAPAGDDRADLGVPAGGSISVERGPTEGEDRRLGIIGQAHAGAAELVVDEALGEEATEQAPDDAVFEAHVDDVVVGVLGGREDDRAYRGVGSSAPPFIAS